MRLSLHPSATLSIIFSCSFLSWCSPLFVWLTLSYPLVLWSSSLLAFGGGIQTICVFQADFLDLCSQSETRTVLFMSSVKQSSSLVSAFNNWRFLMLSFLLYRNRAPSSCLWDYLICCLSCYFSPVCPEARRPPFKRITWSWRCQQMVRVLYA